MVKRALTKTPWPLTSFELWRHPIFGGRTHALTPWCCYQLHQITDQCSAFFKYLFSFFQVFNSCFSVFFRWFNPLKSKLCGLGTSVSLEKRWPTKPPMSKNTKAGDLLDRTYKTRNLQADYTGLVSFTSFLGVIPTYWWFSSPTCTSTVSKTKDPVTAVGHKDEKLKEAICVEPENSQLIFSWFQISHWCFLVKKWLLLIVCFLLEHVVVIFLLRVELRFCLSFCWWAWLGGIGSVIWMIATYRNYWWS